MSTIDSELQVAQCCQHADSYGCVNVIYKRAHRDNTDHSSVSLMCTAQSASSPLYGTDCLLVPVPPAICRYFIGPQLLLLSLKRTIA